MSFIEILLSLLCKKKVVVLINSNTKVSKIIKHNEDAIDVLVSLNSNFKRLRNPVLRNVLAPRVNLDQASKIAKCELSVILSSLEKIGFIIEVEESKEKNYKKTIKMAETKFNIENAQVLDVREQISSGNDPFSIIMTEVNKMQDGDVLNVINVFEPMPLINKLSSDGFDYFIERKGDDYVSTYFKKLGAVNISEIENKFSTEDDFNKVKNFFGENVVEIDVRDLEMPEPMMKILQNVEVLEEGFALYVNHKKVPQYLIPELESKGMKFLINEIDADNVKLLIFK